MRAPSDATGSAWEWPCILAVKFLTTIIRLASSREDPNPGLAAVDALPEDWQHQTSVLLRKLFEDPDPRLDGRVDRVYERLVEHCYQLCAWHCLGSVVTTCFCTTVTKEPMTHRWLRFSRSSQVAFAPKRGIACDLRGFGGEPSLGCVSFSDLHPDRSKSFSAPLREMPQKNCIHQFTLSFMTAPMSEVVEILPALPYEALSHLSEGQTWA